jgi:CRP-like cAMP-binding protein
MIDREEALRHCPVLAEFTDTGIKILASVARERLYPNAQSLQMQGEKPRDDGVVFLVSGRVRCEVRDNEDRVLGLGTLGPGDHLGGLRLMQSTVSLVTAVAEGDVSGLMIDRQTFERLRVQKPQAAMKLLFALSGDFGRQLAAAGGLFGQFAVFASQRLNIEERGTYASYADLGLVLTPTLGTSRDGRGKG